MKVQSNSIDKIQNLKSFAQKFAFTHLIPFFLFPTGLSEVTAQQVLTWLLDDEEQRLNINTGMCFGDILQFMNAFLIVSTSSMIVLVYMLS